MIVTNATTVTGEKMVLTATKESVSSKQIFKATPTTDKVQLLRALHLRRRIWTLPSNWFRHQNQASRDAWSSIPNFFFARILATDSG